MSKRAMAHGVAVGAVGLSLLAVAACGGSSGGPATTTPPGTTPVNTAAPQSSAPAPASTGSLLEQAKAAALTVRLTSADLPGSTSKSDGPESASDRADDARVARCAGGFPPNQDILDTSGPNLTVGTLFVGSEIAVLPTVPDVRADLAAFKSARGTRCVAADLKRSFVSKTTTIADPGHISLSRVPFPGPTQSFLLHLRLVLQVNGQRHPVDLDLVGFARGNAEISLDAAGIDGTVPAATLKALYDDLVQRADQAIPATGLTASAG